MHIATRHPLDLDGDAAELGRRIGRSVHRALLAEVALTPKPGLVDRRNNGAHHDMTLTTFVASARAIAPWFALFFRRGLDACRLPPGDNLPQLRRDGVACESAMFAATGGINTHKGAIFSFGLLCAAAGRLHGQGRRLGRAALCGEAAAICAGIVEGDLGGAVAVATAGERVYRRFGLPGARGEAASAFATVRRHALPAFDRAFAITGSRRWAAFAAFLELLAVNPDTNLVARGGLDGLAFVQRHARALTRQGGVAAADFIARMEEFDDRLIALHLSPGGSADLLAVTCFLARLEA